MSTKRAAKKSSAAASKGKLVDVAEVLPPVAGDDDALRAGAKEVVINTHRTEKFIEPAAVGRDDDPDDPDDPDDDPEDYIFEPSERNTVDEILEQIRGEENAVVIVTRLPDGIANRNRFANPSHSRASCEPIPIEQGMTVEDIYSVCRETNGGGRYQFQIRVGRGFRDSPWEQVILDSIGAREGAQAKAAPMNPAAPVAAAAGEQGASNPIEYLIQQAEMVKRLKNALADDTPKPTAPESRQLENASGASNDPLVTVLSAVKDHPGLTTRVLDHYLGTGEGGSIIKEIAENKDAIASLIETVLSTGAQIFGFTLPGSQATTAPVTNAQPTTPKRQTVQEAVASLLSLAVSELKLNRRTGRTADAIEDAAKKSAIIKGSFNNLVAQPDEALLEQLSQFAKEDLSQLDHALAWIAELKRDLSPHDSSEESFDEDEPARESDEPAEGNGAGDEQSKITYD